MHDVTAMGELLIDFSPMGLSPQGRPLFEQNPGGAPANVLACLSRLGLKTAFMGKVGDDPFGHSLEKTLQDVGVDTRGLLRTDRYPTTLAFVHLDERGDRSFSFYRDPGADLMLQSTELSFNLIDDARAFHFGSVSMTADPARSATLAAVRYAREQQKIISYDPNLRPMLWSSLAQAKKTILSVLPLVDLLKISQEELVFLTDVRNPSRGASLLMQQYENLQLVLVTQGPQGAYGLSRRSEGWHPAYDVKTIDTTGAGDAFTGGFLHQVLQEGKPLSDLSEDDLVSFLAFANATGSLATVLKGAIPAMPTLAQVDECLRHVPLLQAGQEPD